MNTTGTADRRFEFWVALAIVVLLTSFIVLTQGGCSMNQSSNVIKKTNAVSKQYEKPKIESFRLNNKAYI